MKKQNGLKDGFKMEKIERKVNFREPVVSNVYIFEKESEIKHSTHYNMLGSVNRLLSETKLTDETMPTNQTIAMVQLSGKKIIENINLLLSNLDKLKEYQVNTFTEAHQEIKNEAEKALKEFNYGLKNFPESEVNELEKQINIELKNYQAFAIGDVYDLNLLIEKSRHNFALLNQHLYEINFSSPKAKKSP